MANITPELIKKLRDRTGVGIGKCKEALAATDGDIETAISNLRKAGMASAVKKADRETNEGMIGFAENDQCIAVAEVNAETDFVVKNDKFVEFLKNIVEEVAATQPKSLEDFLAQKYSKEPTLTIDEFRGTIVQMIGENIQISRILIVPKSAKNSLGVYSHMNGKIVTLVEIEGESGHEDLAKDVAMHAAASHPDYLNPESVPADVLNHEKEIAKSQIPPGKPDNIIDKILEGKVRAFYDQACLSHQKFIKDDSVTIEQLIKKAGNNLSIKSFSRWAIGQK